MSTPTIPRPADRGGRSAGSTEDTDHDAKTKAKGAKGKDKADPKDAEAAAAKKKKKMIIVGAVIAAVALAWFMFLRPSPAHTGEPEPGMVVQLDPLTLNLEGGHYLKISMALQFTEAASGGGGGHGGAAEEPDGAQALDIAISQLSNQKIAALNTAKARETAKAKLLTAIAEAYHGDVMDLYFTEFVMQ